ncbi:gliding motility-associated C-terminal domain-containing protein [Galbibacter mesophilus]|uniref:gliding motility-associated C-terminal domain-containing protein n=1 Tax=Galbibacter mesophilus TaxID=379069 RepID=UPI00191F072A|nr:gliding motility-associated C-terminal domain-containing protein [Galbibacter mesophilus]MCM5661357.1 gliding motility-associated C-terminal domain-containing protein [Galbibacter mesophilus]
MRTNKMYIHIVLFSLFCYTLCAQEGRTATKSFNEGTLVVLPGTEFSVVNDFQNNGELYNDGETYIYADLINDGVLDRLETTGRTYFIGNTNQLITGNEEMYLYNVSFVNRLEGAQYYLEGNLNIDGEADFTNGIVNNDDHGGTFRLGSASNVVNASKKSFVDGNVHVENAAEYAPLPTGDVNYYSPIGFRNNSGLELNTRGKYYREDPTIRFDGLSAAKGTTLTAIDEREYWEFESGEGDGSNYFLTIPANGTESSEFEDIDDNKRIKVLWWDATDQSWTVYDSVYDRDTETVTALVSHDGFFTLGLVVGESLPCDGIEVYNAVTPDGDGRNDFFKIAFKSGEDRCPSLESTIHVEIYNRWGVKVFETENYGSSLGEDVFTGISEGRATLVAEDGLPSGTYYYIIRFSYDTGLGSLKQYDKAGYLYVSDN